MTRYSAGMNNYTWSAPDGMVVKANPYLTEAFRRDETVFRCVADWFLKDARYAVVRMRSVGVPRAEHFRAAWEHMMEPANSAEWRKKDDTADYMYDAIPLVPNPLRQAQAL